MRPIAIALLAAAVTGCGSSGNSPDERSGAAGARGRIERCVDRLLQNGRPQDAKDEAAARRYVRQTYCERFETNGWVYEDGALAIAAHTALEQGGTCAASRVGEPAGTVPCDDVTSSGARILDCALLHHVRRSEVKDYIDRLGGEGAVQCDDGTSLNDLGAAEGDGPTNYAPLSPPTPIGDRVVITRGKDWAFFAWRSTIGLCTSLELPENHGGTSCGIPVVGSPEEPRGRKHLVVGGSYQGFPDDDLWLNGVAAANVRRVEVELIDGRSLEAPLYDAPAALGLDLEFFLVRTRPPEHWRPPKAGIPEPPFRAFSAYDGGGRLLERFGPPAARNRG